MRSQIQPYLITINALPNMFSDHGGILFHQIYLFRFYFLSVVLISYQLLVLTVEVCGT
jgi:hypothetical protein